MFASRNASFSLVDHWPWIAVVLAIAVYRAISGFVSPLPLQVDEAQYVGWSHFLSAGYFSKPPVIAWAIAAGQGVCSLGGVQSVEGCSRLLQPIAFLVSGCAVGATAHRLFANSRITFWSALLFSCLPLAGFYSLFASTDAWLILFWALALWLLVIASHSDQNNLLIWAALGAVAGLGLLSKYSMGAFVLGAFFWLLISKRLMRMGPWAALLVAALVFLPNLLWNYQNGFPTFAHHAEISQLAAETVRPLTMTDRLTSVARFIAEQFGLFGPLLMLALITSVFGRRHRLHNDRTDLAVNAGHADSATGHDHFISANKNGRILLQIMTWIILALAVVQAFSSRSFANWAAPAYASGTILAAHILITHRQSRGALLAKAVLILSLVIGVAISLGLIHASKFFFYQTPDDVAQTQYRVRALEKIRGWKEAALWVKETAPKNGWVVIAQDRRLLAAVSAYGYPEVSTPYAWNPQGRRDSHYNWFLDVEKQGFGDQQRFLFLRLIRPDSGEASRELPGSPSNASFDFGGVSPSGLRIQAIRKIATPELPTLGGDGERLQAFEVTFTR